MRQDELKQAAIQVFAARGYHAAKVSDIVAHAGVAQGTFYLYFKSKQAIFGELLSDYLDLLTTAAAVDFNGINELDDLRDVFVRVGMQLVDVFVNNQELTRIFFTEALAVDPEFNAMIDAFYARLVAMIRMVNEFGFTAGYYRSMDFTVLAHAVVGMTERVATQYIVREGLDPAGREQVVGEVIDLVLFGAVKPDVGQA